MKKHLMKPSHITTKNRVCGGIFFVYSVDYKHHLIYVRRL